MQRLQVATIVAKSIELDSTSCNVVRSKKGALQVAEVPCYTAHFSSNLQRNTVALQVAVKIAQCNRALNYERDIDILIPNSATVRFSECSEKDDTDKEFLGFEVPPSQESE